MSFHLHPRQRNTTKRGAVIITITALLILGIYALAPSFFSGLLRKVASPINTSKQYISKVISGTKFWSSKASLVDENIRLRKQNEALEEKLIDYSMIRTQNEELRGVLSMRTGRQAVGATVVLHVPQSPYDFYTLQLPDGHRVSVGNVIVVGRTAIGKIVEVNGRYAKAELFSSPKVQTEVRLLKNGTPLTLLGRGGGNFSLSAPRDLDIANGDILTYSEDPEFALAVVRSVEETESDSFKQVRLLSPQNIFTQRYVEVLYAE